MKLLSLIHFVGCLAGTYEVRGVYFDVKSFSKSYLVVIYCNGLISYLAYEKPDYPKTKVSLDSVNSLPIDLKSADMLLHSGGWLLAWKSFDTNKLLNSTLNFALAASKSNCSDYEVLLTYEKPLTKENRKLYSVVLFCPRVLRGSAMYATIATVSDADWFQPVMIDRLRALPPNGFAPYI